MRVSDIADRITADSGVDLDTAIKSTVFQDWLSEVDPRYVTLHGVCIQSVDLDPASGKVKFVKFEVDITDKAGASLGGKIVFARGGSVGILFLLRYREITYTVLTVQVRTPTGGPFTEIPAGTLFGSGDFTGVAAQEIDEELGIKIDARKLGDLSGLAGHKNGIYPSPGALAETIRLYCYHLGEVGDAEFASIQGRATGVLSEGERIKLHCVPFEDMLKFPDGKSLIAYLLYTKFVLEST